MFDFSRLIDVAKGLIGPNLNVPEVPMNDVVSTLANAGLDVSALQGLAPDQFGAFLSEHGVDINALAPEQLSELARAAGLESSIGELLGHASSEDFANR